MKFLNITLPYLTNWVSFLGAGETLRARTGIPGNIVTHLYLTYDTPCDPNVDLEAGITDHRQPPSHHWDQGVS